MMGQVGGKEPFEDGRKDLELLAGLGISTKAVERVAEAEGEQIEQQNQREQKQIFGGKVVPFLGAGPRYPSCTWRSTPAGYRSCRGRPKGAKAKTKPAGPGRGRLSSGLFHSDGGGRGGVRGTG